MELDPAALKPADDDEIGDPHVSESPKAETSPGRPRLRITVPSDFWQRPVRWTYILAFVYAALWTTPHALRWMGIQLGGGLPEDWFLATFGHDRMAVWEGEYWRLLTGTFLHAGFLHLLLNTVLLVYVGRVIERVLGARRFLVDYFLCGIAGALAFQSAAGPAAGVGASGAILGVAGIFFVGIFSRKGSRGVELGGRFWLFVVVAIVLLVLEGELGGFVLRHMQRGEQIAVSAHLGGFICGGFLGYLALLPRGELGRGRRLRATYVLAALFLGTGLYAFAYPVFDWSWHVWQAKRVLEAGDRPAAEAHYSRALELGGGDGAAASIVQIEAGEHGDLQEAWRRWKLHPIENVELCVMAGYGLYDALAAKGWESESDALLDELIGVADGILENDRSPHNLNTAAWFRALRRSDLETAASYAEEACNGERRSEILNTLGWVRFQLGQQDVGLELMHEAAQKQPTPPHFLYLALGYWQRGQEKDARIYVDLAASGKRFLMENEQRLLEEIQSSLSSG